MRTNTGPGHKGLVNHSSDVVGLWLEVVQLQIFSDDLVILRFCDNDFYALE